MKFVINMLCTFLTLFSIGSVVIASPKRYDDRTLEEVSHEEGLHKDHRRHQERKISELREKLDTALLRQEIQEIELNNFRKSLKSTEAVLAQLLEERKIASNLLEKQTENIFLRPESATTVKTPEAVNQVALNAQMDLRQDFLRLKAEMESLKSTCLKRSAESDAKREDTTLKWLLQVVPLLQQNLGDLQESTNVLEEMHNKKETDIKIASLVAELASMAKSLAKMTAKVEAVEAVAQMLNQEFAQGSSQMHQMETKVAVIKEKLDEDTEILDSLLKALPDGFLGSKHTKITSRLLHSKPPEVKDDNQDLVQKIEKLELKTATLDFALLNLQKKVFMQSTENKQMEPDLMANHALTTSSLVTASVGGEYLSRLKIVEDELLKIKKSSSSLVKMLSEVEKFDEGIKDELTEEMSGLATQLEHEHEDRLVNENDSKSSRRDLEVEEHTDIFEFKRILDSVAEKVSKLEHTYGHSDNNKKCYTILQERLNQTDERVFKLEQLSRHGNHGNRAKRRHHHGDGVS